MNGTEILLSESQERMVYEVEPGNVDRVEEVAERYEMQAAVIGETTDDGVYHCTFEGETVVETDAEFLGDGAPMNDLGHVEPERPERDVPEFGVESGFEAVVGAPNTASKRWVYRQYDHEVQLRTARRPGDDAAIIAVREASAEPRSAEQSSGENRETGIGLALSAGADPNWTDAAPYEGARAVGLENATNLAAKGATPHAAVDCLNGGNPEKPAVYGGFKAIVDGLADVCRELEVPVVGGNVSLYNDSAAGPIPPTPTVTMVGVKEGFDAPPLALSGEGRLLLVGDTDDPKLGGSELLARLGGSDRFPELPEAPAALIETVAEVADFGSTLATHDVSHGGLAVALAEMVTEETGADVSLDETAALFDEQPGRVVVETTDPESVREACRGVAPVTELGEATTTGELELTVDGETATYSAEDIADLRAVIEREL